jgi:hypothetical protein
MGMSDDSWTERMIRALRDAEAVTRRRMGQTADLLAGDVRIDELEAQVERLEDPVQREQQLLAVRQLRWNNRVMQEMLQQQQSIADLQQAIVVLTEAIRRLEQDG